MAGFEIQPAVWARDIRNKLFQDNSFLTKSVNDDKYVKLGRTVVLPQGGSRPIITRDRPFNPAGTNTRRRIDTATGYELHTFYAEPEDIELTVEIEASYNLRNDLIEQNKLSNEEAVANYVLYNWQPRVDNFKVRTSGATRDGIAQNSTANTLKITPDDFVKAKRIHDKQNVPSQGRCVLMPSEMYNDLLTDEDVKQAMIIGNMQGTLVSGSVGRLLGYDIFIRSNACEYTLDLDPFDYDYEPISTTNLAASLFWHPSFVRRALGSIEVFYNARMARSYGDEFSTTIRAGGKIAHANETGVVALVEGYA